MELQNNIPVNISECKCDAKINYPEVLANGLFEMCSMCIVQRMMEIGVTPQGIKDFAKHLQLNSCPLIDRI